MDLQTHRRKYSFVNADFSPKRASKVAISDLYMSCLVYSRYKLQQKPLIASRQGCDEAVKINSYRNVVKTMFANNSPVLFTLSVLSFAHKRFLATCTCCDFKLSCCYSYLIGRNRLRPSDDYTPIQNASNQLSKYSLAIRSHGMLEMWRN